MLYYYFFGGGNEITSCKGGFLYDSLQALNFGAHANNYVGGYGKYQGLRLVRFGYRNMQKFTRLIKQKTLVFSIC